MDERLAIDGGTPVRTRPFPPHYNYDDADIALVTEVIRSGNVAKGPKVAEFGRLFASRHGVKRAFLVTSGTAAMHVCVAALDPQPGDEVIVSPWTSGGSFIGAMLHNCVPVFADIDDSYNLDPRDVEAKITPRTRAIIAVHLFGNPCNMDALLDIARRHNVALIEDCCQALLSEYQGKVVGSIGDIAGYSFSGKHISVGSGGVVLTDREELWRRAVLFADGALPRADSPLAGQPYANYFLAPVYRYNDLVAAVLLAQMGKIDGYIANKIRAAQQIQAGVADIAELMPQKVRPGDRHTYWVLGFTIDTQRLSCDAWQFAEALRMEGIPDAYGPYIGSGREGPLYRNPFIANPEFYGPDKGFTFYRRDQPLDVRQVECPYGEALMCRGVLLTIRQSFSEEDVADIIKALRKVATHYRKRVG